MFVIEMVEAKYIFECEEGVLIADFSLAPQADVVEHIVVLVVRALGFDEIRAVELVIWHHPV
jgi:hypothetical protein